MFQIIPEGCLLRKCLLRNRTLTFVSKIEGSNEVRGASKKAIIGLFF